MRRFFIRLWRKFFGRKHEALGFYEIDPNDYDPAGIDENEWH